MTNSTLSESVKEGLKPKVTDLTGTAYEQLQKLLRQQGWGFDCNVDSSQDGGLEEALKRQLRIFPLGLAKEILISDVAYDVLGRQLPPHYKAVYYRGLHTPK